MQKAHFNLVSWCALRCAVVCCGVQDDVLLRALRFLDTVIQRDYAQKVWQVTIPHRDNEEQTVSRQMWAVARMLKSCESSKRWLSIGCLCVL